MNFATTGIAILSRLFLLKDMNLIIGKVLGVQTIMML